MAVPNHLDHQPIIAVDNYQRIDGMYAPNSDAKALSIGHAQYDDQEIAVKIFRHTGNKWSRQSEELPLHRNLDLTILIIGSLLNNLSGQIPVTNLNEQIIEPDETQEIADYYQANQVILRPRLEEIRRLLDLFL